MEKTKKKSSSVMANWLMILLFAFLSLYVIITIMPVLWAAVSSFKDKNAFYDEIFSFPTKLPGEHLFSNYVEAYEKMTYMTTKMVEVSVWGQLGNSLLYVAGSMIVQTFTPCLVAYVVARYDYKFLKVLYAINIITMALPIIGALPAEVQMVKALNLDQKVWGLWILKTHFLGMGFLIFHAQFSMIPKDYTEAATVDGASPFRIMTQIIMPLAWSTISTMLLLNFITYWNEYQTPLLYMETQPVLAIGIYSFYTSYRVTNGAVKIAGLIMLTIPMIIVFIIFQDKLMANLSVGGIKG